MERGEWLTSMPVWVKRPAPMEEGRRKSEGNLIGAQQGGRGVGDGTVFNHRFEPQLQINENLGLITQASLLENLRLAMGADGRVICLWFRPKGGFHRSCMLSHAPLRNHNQDLVIHFIRGGREAMNKNKRKFDASENSYPTRDTGTGVDITDIGTQRLRTARYLVADVAEAETKITVEAVVGEG